MAPVGNEDDFAKKITVCLCQGAQIWAFPTQNSNKVPIWNTLTPRNRGPKKVVYNNNSRKIAPDFYHPHGLLLVSTFIFRPPKQDCGH